MAGGRDLDGHGRVLVALGLSTGPLIALGLGRFAYAMLLPAMREDLGWSYAAAGAMNTANAAGYLLGAVVAAPLARRVGARRVFLAGAWMASAAIALTAASEMYAVLLVVRLAAGVGGGLAFVIGGGLVAEASHRASRGRAALMLGLYFGGVGAGIALAGLLVPWVLSVTGGAGWRQGWLVLAGLALVASVVATASARRVRDPAPVEPGSQRWDRAAIAWLTAAYTCFGLGYIAYLTFMTAFLVDSGMSEPLIAGFWVLVGVAAWLSPAWGPVFGWVGGARGMALVLVVLAVGTVLPVLSGGIFAAYLSGLLVGGTFLACVTAMSVGVRESLPQPHWTAGLGFATVAFGLGQTIGPSLTGWVSDRTRDLGSGLLLSGAILVLGIVLALVHHRRSAATPRPQPPPAT